jgi:hypothetical protein
MNDMHFFDVVSFNTASVLLTFYQSYLKSLVGFTLAK